MVWRGILRVILAAQAQQNKPWPPPAFLGTFVGDSASNILTGGAAAQPAQAATALTAADESQCLRRVKRGDLEAFGPLVTGYQDRVFNMILRMCGVRAEAEELTQETFLRALERIRQFRGKSSFYTWLFRIAANLTISHLRRARRVKFRPLAQSDSAGDGQSKDLSASLVENRSPDPPAAAMAAETRRRVAEALERLGAEFRLVVILRDIEDMDYSRISEVTGLPTGTVKSRLHRARCILRDTLADLDEIG